jgi:glycosyltransferase involved in cell wall biosynthesis
MVTVSTPYLAELYAPFNSNIRVLPNCVKAELLDMPRKRAERLTIGWQGGTSHLVDLCTVQDELRDVLAAHPDADLHFIGQDLSPLQWVKNPALRSRCRFTPWSDDVGDYYKAVDFDIAIAPLADVPFNRAKSHLKALDAAARGIPVIAQDMEPYREFVRDGETGYLVRTGEEWVKRLTDLIHDEAAREEMGAAARKAAAAYTMQGNWTLWQDAYEAAAGGR